MNSQNFFKGSNTNWKYILIVTILAFLVGGGILGYQYWWVPRQEVELPEVKAPERVTKEEADLSSEALATEDWKTYRNEGFGFEVKFPKEWKTDAEIDDSSLKYDPSLKHFSISCTKETSFETLSFRLLVNLYGEPGAISPQSLYEGEEIMVENIDLTPGIYSFGSSHEVFSDFCVDKNLKEISPIFPVCEQDSGNFYFQFYLSCEGKGWKGEEGRNKCSQLFNQILSTFRFLE